MLGAKPVPTRRDCRSPTELNRPSRANPLHRLKKSRLRISPGNHSDEWLAVAAPSESLPDRESGGFDTSAAFASRSPAPQRCGHHTPLSAPRCPRSARHSRGRGRYRNWGDRPLRFTRIACVRVQMADSTFMIDALSGSRDTRTPWFRAKSASARYSRAAVSITS